MIKEMNTKAHIGGLLLILEAGLFVAGAIGVIAGFLSEEQIPAIAVSAIIFNGAGSGTKRKEASK
ncbi:MAG: hypothetical protein IMF18_02130 [Proteobacteria bacterium]|nr:hypothetical protein [Pseudomonadota bacterium]